MPIMNTIRGLFGRTTETPVDTNPVINVENVLVVNTEVVEIPNTIPTVEIVTNESTVSEEVLEQIPTEIPMEEPAEPEIELPVLEEALPVKKKRINLNKLAETIVKTEGLGENLSIAQVKEMLGILGNHWREIGDEKALIEFETIKEKAGLKSNHRKVK